MDGVEAVAVTERIGGRGLRRGRIDDPDLDDALRPGTLQQPTHLRTRDAEPLGDRVLGLAELVVEPARLDEHVAIARGHRDACHPEAHRCSEQMCMHPGHGDARALGMSNRRRSRREAVVAMRTVVMSRSASLPI